MIFLIFLLLFNISIDDSRAYFYSPDDKSDVNDKQCFCEVSGSFVKLENFLGNFLFVGTRKHDRSNNKVVFRIRAISHSSNYNFLFRC